MMTTLNQTSLSGTSVQCPSARVDTLSFKICILSSAALNAVLLTSFAYKYDPYFVLSSSFYVIVLR